MITFKITFEWNDFNVKYFRHKDCKLKNRDWNIA